ncbi:hypothetical protein SEA_SAPO_54 [Gordonia phage Sapo]|nr:hypothetical protein SEA_SAPO_54 [Gordonia phage Sapo]
MAELKKLNYKGKVEADLGDAFGPDSQGAWYSVVDSTYDPEKDRTTLELAPVYRPGVGGRVRVQGGN